MDWTLKIGGAAGQGMQAISDVLARVFVRAGLYVFVAQDFESRIRGGHNFTQMRISNNPVNAMSARVDILVAFDEQTLKEHLSELSDGGIVVWDPEALKIADTGERGFPVPLQKLLVQAGAQKIMMNTAATGAVLGMVRFPLEHLAPLMEEQFGRKGREVVDENMKAAKAGYDYAVENCTLCKMIVEPVENSRRMIMTGCDAVALGAMAAGLRFMSAYPMSPSTPIIEFLARRAESHGMVIEQAEDEIAAINLAIGASFVGARAMTATSGGGFSLMAETVGLAGMTETPVVIVEAQRPGPSTGLPTRTEQSDLLFVIHAAQGEFPRAVFAPGDAAQAFHIMPRAFNIAEKYQTPVIVLIDQYLADSIWTTPALDAAQVEIDRGELLDSNAPADYRRYAVTDSGVSPRALPGAGPALVVADSDEHNEEGHITESAEVRNSLMRKRMRKMELIRAEMPPPERYGPDAADVSLLCWGSNLHVASEAVDILNESRPGAANCFHFTGLWPLPVDEITKLIGECKRLVTVENNATAQLAKLLRMETGIHVEKSILKYDGRPFIPGHVAEALRREALS